MLESRLWRDGWHFSGDWIACFYTMRTRNLGVLVSSVVVCGCSATGHGGLTESGSGLYGEPQRVGFETPYLEANIAATRDAYALERIEVRSL